MINRHDHTPAGTTSFLELVDIIVSRIYGKDAIAESVIRFTGGGECRQVVYERAGKPILFAEDCKRRDEAKESIIKACFERKLAAYVRNQSGNELKIAHGHWAAGSKYAWITASSGRFDTATEPSYHNCAIYFQNDEVAQFLDSLFHRVDRNLTDREKDFFRKADNWGEVSFLISIDGITVKVKKSKKVFSLKEFERIFPSSKVRNFLFKVIEFSGTFDVLVMPKIKKGSLKGYVSDLRKNLKELFDIDADPIQSTGGGNYATMFSVASKITMEDFAEKEDILEAQIPKEIRRRIDSSPPEDYLR